MPSSEKSARPLPGLVKLYLATLYLSLALCIGLVIVSFIALGSFYQVIALLAALVFAVVGMFLYGNIRAIHGRRPSAPSYSRKMLVAGGILGAIAIIAGLYLLSPEIGFYNDSNIFFQARVPMLNIVTAGQNLVFAAALVLYWRHSPRVQETFGTTGEFSPNRTPFGLHLSRLAGMFIAVTGLLYLISSLCLERFTPLMLLWAVAGSAIFYLADPCRVAKRGTGSLLGFCLLTAAALYLADIYVRLQIGKHFGEPNWLLLFIPRPLLFGLVCAILCYAAYMRPRPCDTGMQLSGLSRRLDKAFNSGISWMEAAAIPAFALFSMSQYLSLVFGNKSADLMFYCYALVLAFCLAAVIGGALVILTSPGNTTFLLRSMSAGVFISILIACFAEVYLNSQGSTRPIPVMVYRELSRILIAGLIMVALWKPRDSDRPAAIIILRGIGWYYVAKAAAYIVALVSLAIPNSQTSILQFLGSDGVLVMGAAAWGLLRATGGEKGARSFARVSGWVVFLLVGSMFADMVINGIFSFFDGKFDMFHNRLSNLGFGIPWWRPLTVGIALLLWMLGTAPKERAWFGLPPNAHPAEDQPCQP